MSKLRTTLLLALAMFLEALGYGIVAPTLPFIAREMGATQFQTGLLFSLYALVGVVGVIPLGLLADRFGRRVLIFVGLGALIVGSIGFAHAPTLALLLVARVFQGLGGNAIWVGSLSMQGDLSSREGMGLSISWLTAAWSVGFMIGPVLGGIGESLRTPFYLYAVGSALALILCILMLPRSFRSGRSFGVEKFRRVLRLRNLWVSGTVVFLMAAFYGAFEAFIPTFLGDRGSSRFSIAILFSVMAMPTIVLPPLAALIADRIGDRNLLRWSLPAWALLTGASMFLLEEFPPAITFALLGAAEVFIFVPSVTALHRGVPTEDRGSASSANNFMFSCGFMLGPFLAGTVIVHVGHHGIFLALGAASLAGAWFVQRVFRDLEPMVAPVPAGSVAAASLPRHLEPPA